MNKKTKKTIFDSQQQSEAMTTYSMKGAKQKRVVIILLYRHGSGVLSGFDIFLYLKKRMYTELAN